MAKNYIGIDLGTTETVVSVVEMQKGDNPIEKIRSLDIHQFNANHELDRNNKKLQSSIYIDRDNKKVYTGEYAKKLYTDGNRPLNTIRSVKTRIGGESMIDIPLDTDECNLKSYDMTELSAVLLKTVKKSIDKQITGTIDEVTITIPAGFNSDERNATIDAAQMARFPKINLLDEPTAVLLNFLNSPENSLTIADDFFREPKNIVVYDIGGGTLDISIAKVEDNGDFDVDILSRSKRMNFGGDDIDKYISSYFLQEFEKKNIPLQERNPKEQAMIVSRVIANAEKSKIAFSQEIAKHIENERRRKRVKESVNFEIIDSLKITDLTLTDELLKSILQDIISNSGVLLKPLRETLQSAKLKSKDIDLVILTGGSGKFYLVEETLRKIFPNTDIEQFTKYDAVSKGASIHSFNQDNEELKSINIDDIMSNSIYIKRLKGFDKLVPHNQDSDTKGSYSFIFEEHTDRLELFLYYGSDNEKPYHYKEITGIFKQLNKNYKKGEKIQIDWEFDSNKTIKLFLNSKEIVSSDAKKLRRSELLDVFTLK